MKPSTTPSNIPVCTRTVLLVKRDRTTTRATKFPHIVPYLVPPQKLGMATHSLLLSVRTRCTGTRVLYLSRVARHSHTREMIRSCSLAEESYGTQNTSASS